MTRFPSTALLGPALLCLVACGRAPPPAAPRAAPVAAAPEKLSRIVDRYWDEHVPAGDPLSPQFVADSLAIERRYLADVLAVPRAGLDADARLNYDIFRRKLEQDIEAFTYPAELLPMNPFDGTPRQFARAAAEIERHPLRTIKDYENWQLRIDDYVRWTKQATANMREGIRRGYTSPRTVIERMLPLLKGLGEDTPANVFYVPLRTMPQAISEPERTRLSASLSAAIRDQLLPANRELHAFLQNEYMPRARMSVSLSVLPLGPSWYAALVKRMTSSQLTADEIHAIGIAEAERIRTRLLSIPAGPPSIPPAAEKGELLDAYRQLKAQVQAALPAQFAAAPRSDLEISAWVPFGDPGASLMYRRAAPQTGRPATLYVNTGAYAGLPWKIETARFLLEAIPGRHYQAALQQERNDLPRFRRFGGEPAFVEGWALYAASLGEEMGLYRDDDAKRGALALQLRCAVALVADTGVHAKNWTREQAAGYLRAQLALEEPDANLMVDRLAALPGAALACKMGELKFQALRSRAQQLLGPRFDIREFHSAILRDGAMPLDILESKIKLWTEAQR